MTLFFGMCQGIGERKEYQVESGNVRRRIGRDLVPIRHFGIYEQIWYESILVWKVLIYF